MLSLSEQAAASQVQGGSKPRATSQLIPTRNASSPALFSFLTYRQDVQLPLPHCARVPPHTHTHTGRSGRPTFSRLSINPTSKGLSQCLYLAVMQVLWSKERSWFPLSRLGAASHTCFHLLNIPTSSYFLSKNNKNLKQGNAILLMMSKDLVAFRLLIPI